MFVKNKHYPFYVPRARDPLGQHPPSRRLRGDSFSPAHVPVTRATSHPYERSTKHPERHPPTPREAHRIPQRGEWPCGQNVCGPAIIL